MSMLLAVVELSRGNNHGNNGKEAMSIRYHQYGHVLGYLRQYVR